MNNEPTHREKLLGQALRDLLVHIGVYHKDAGATGPELLSTTYQVINGDPYINGEARLEDQEVPGSEADGQPTRFGNRRSGPHV